MCLIAFAWQCHEDYPLIVLANRDEFFRRPAQPAHWWADAPELLAGRDLQAGGSWMGLAASGRFAALTNFREPSQPAVDAPSRGGLVRAALESTASAHDELQALAARCARYAGFNLLVGDGKSLGVLESRTGTVRMLEAGVYGLSNHLLDSPWPKLVKVREGLRQWLALDADNAGASLPEAATALTLQLLRDDRPVADEHLPTTGLDLEWERALSAPFIRAPGYGTRCTSLVCVAGNGDTQLHEWSWDEHGKLRSEVNHRFLRR